MATADGAGRISVWSSQGCVWRRARRGGGRVKALAGLCVGSREQCASLDEWAASFRLVAAASSGAAEAWAPAGPADDLDDEAAAAPAAVAAGTTARLTCLAVHAAPTTRPRSNSSFSGEASKRGLKDKLKRKRARSRSGSGV